MNGIVIAIIAITIALVVGPLLWLRPTPRDRQLERLRAHARNRGLNVAMHLIDDPDPHFSDRVSSGGKLRHPTLTVAHYQLPLHLPSTLHARQAPAWEVVRVRENDRDQIEAELSAGLRPGWRFSKPGLPLIEKVVGRLSELLARAPRGTVKIEGSAEGCGLYWLERGDVGEVDRIAELLEALRAFELELTRDAAREEALRRDEEPDLS